MHYYYYYCVVGFVFLFRMLVFALGGIFGTGYKIQDKKKHYFRGIYRAVTGTLGEINGEDIPKDMSFTVRITQIITEESDQSYSHHAEGSVPKLLVKYQSRGCRIVGRPCNR